MRSVCAGVAVILAGLLGGQVGAVFANESPPAPERAAEPAAISGRPLRPRSAAANKAGGKPRAIVRSAERLPAEPPLPPELEAGVIPRPALQAELASGIGRFLQQVRTEPSLSGGRFIGWRVLTLFPNRSDIRVQVLRPGDTVTRVNGQPIERPEQLVHVWKALSQASELVIDIQRDERPSRLRYAIQ